MKFRGLYRHAACVATLIFLSSTNSIHAAVPLVRDGTPLARIYVSHAAEPLPHLKPENWPLATATHELNYHLQKMSGATLEVVETADAAVIQRPAIVLGDLAVKRGATPEKTVESKEGFRLLSQGDTLLIGGQSDAAVLLGVYEVLNKLGCEWVMPGEIGEIIPRQTTVVIGDLDESQAPDFLSRLLWYRGYNQPRLAEEGERYGQWHSRQKGGAYRHPVVQVGGHMWDQFIGRHAADFEKDPTMFALRRGPDGTLQRGGPQLETTHPRVIELIVQEIKDTFEKHKLPHDAVVGFPAGPADGLGYSMSAESLAVSAGRIDPIFGELDRTDEVVLLCNTILEKLGPEYPNTYVGFYSYSIHGDYPMRYKPHPRVAVIFAPISFSRMHSVLDTNSKTQAYYKDVVEQWGKLSREQGNPLAYRGYSWNLAENLMPYSKVRIWGEELPFYKQQGFIGHTVEATKMWSINGPSDFVFMKMAWDTSRDWKQLLHHYCTKSFGAGAAPMERYLLRLISTQHDAGQEAGSYWSFPLVFDEVFVEAAKKDFAEATALAQDPNEDIRIGHIASSVEALRLYLAYFRATTDFNFPAAIAGYDAMRTHWQSTYDSNTDLVANEAPFYLERFIGRFVDEALKFSTGEYRLLERLPDAMPTLLDPNAVGDRMQFYSPTLQEAYLLKTKTYSSTWDAQGLAGVRSGAVWYRHRFSLPAELKGKPVGLFLGGFEDEARVWINGQLVGTSGQGFSIPAVFDLNEGLNYDGDNSLAIQVVRNSTANEIGLGGLIRPSFLFTGPRLKLKAPKPLELRRVLPGGELGDVVK